MDTRVLSIYLLVGVGLAVSLVWCYRIAQRIESERTDDDYTAPAPAEDQPADLHIWNR